VAASRAAEAPDTGTRDSLERALQHFAPPKVKIRDATPDEAREIAEIGERFHSEAQWGDIVAYSVEDCQKTIRTLIENEDGICIVADDGGKIIGIAGGLVHPFYFNHAHRTGMELFWWVDPEYRGGVGLPLFTALEDAARDRGCESWAMIALDRVNPDLTGRIYQRRGYRASEHSWIKRL
jgi:hypothetical protein